MAKTIRSLDGQLRDRSRGAIASVRYRTERDSNVRRLLGAKNEWNAARTTKRVLAERRTRRRFKYSPALCNQGRRAFTATQCSRAFRNREVGQSYVRKDGSAAWVNLFGSFVREENGPARIVSQGEAPVSLRIARKGIDRTQPTGANE